MHCLPMPHVFDTLTVNLAACRHPDIVAFLPQIMNWLKGTLTVAAKFNPSSSSRSQRPLQLMYGSFGQSFKQLPSSPTSQTVLPQKLILYSMSSLEDRLLDVALSVIEYVCSVALVGDVTSSLTYPVTPGASLMLLGVTLQSRHIQ